MKWRTEWKALSDHISGLLEAGAFYMGTRAIRSDDAHRVAEKQLIPQAKSVFDSLKRFRENHHSQIPQSALASIDSFFTKFDRSFNQSGTDFHGQVQLMLTALCSFAAEFKYQISDLSENARRLSERAFIHLQRLIVVDSDVRKKWGEAFKNGEIYCEKLGAVHLLSHGIWAFKLSAEGERTDLVFGESIADLTEIGRAAEALVLTEWKRVQNGSDLHSIVTRAEEQAARYSQGILGGLELVQYRYIVIVTEKKNPMPADNVLDGCTYRHINIAVDPDPPSRA
jgi:hypothetical protein